MRKQCIVLFLTKLLIIGLVTVTATMAQVVRGRVSDGDTKSSIPGAIVAVMNTKVGTTADANGNYTLKLSPGGYTLRVSFVGYETLSVPVTVSETGGTVVSNAVLTEAASSLNEVVVLG